MKISDSNTLPTLPSKRINATASGYTFSIEEEVWTLNKDVKINVGSVARLFTEPTRSGFLETLAFFASNYSGTNTKSNSERIKAMLRLTDASEISETVLINYRAMLTPETEWYLGTIRTFLKRWHTLGHPGVSKEVISMLKGWRIKGCMKGESVKRLDPIFGPLTDIELPAFNEGAIQVYERGIISLSELAMSLIASNTGRRSIQISHLRVADVLRGNNHKGEPYYVLRVPRAKQGTGFRKSFRPFATTQELWALVNAQAKFSIRRVEEHLGMQLQDADCQQVPLFLDMKALEMVSSINDFHRLINTDKLHIASAEITRALKRVVTAADVHSERTGEVLHINARRFRYTVGTRAAREGFGELVIAELLDHSDTQNANIYIKNVPEHVKRLDEAVGFQLAPYAQAFAGVLVDSEMDAQRGDDPTSRIRGEEGYSIGTCGEHGFCGANVPIPCYTCMHFQPWLDGPHNQVYQGLLAERERIRSITGDDAIAAVLDPSIIAVAEVIQRCKKRKEELKQQAEISDA